MNAFIQLRLFINMCTYNIYSDSLTIDENDLLLFRNIGTTDVSLFLILTSYLII